MEGALVDQSGLRTHARLRARTLATRETEAAVACNVLNRTRALGWPTLEKIVP